MADNFDKQLEKTLASIYNDATKAYQSVGKYAIEVGVIDASNTKRKATIKISKDITNAELMFIHEKGSPLRHIPARPVLQMTINYAKSTLLPSVLNKIAIGCFNQHWDEDDVKEELEKTCIRLQSYARKLIYNNDGSLIANAPSTIKRKGDNHPLFDTGQLARSITCQLVKR